ncbi:IclR family transcriptional regulator [Sneathiella glossodoripedis]|uniref:IclR family transcriptional regulator n=1 Tax=Sneathiella glossodoripedis TaxID=418853 RepID=UPI00046FB31C|nr:IclR family transcriptional regulator [Sneathiella glossodoripedis]
MSAARNEGPMVLPRAFSLLRLLSNMQDGLNLSQISNRLDVPKSSLLATLKALTDQGFLVRRGTIYQLGPEAFSLASIILAGRSLRQIARPFLEKSMEDCGETVLLAELAADRRNAIYVDLVESPKSVRFSVSVGTQRPLYASSSGRLLLAHMSDEERDEYLSTVEFKKWTEVTIVDPDELRTHLKETVIKGVAETYGDFTADASGFSSPVFNSDGDVVAALTIAVPISRALREKEKFAKAAVHSAAEISKILGFKGSVE